MRGNSIWTYLRKNQHDRNCNLFLGRYWMTFGKIQLQRIITYFKTRNYCHNVQGNSETISPNGANFSCNELVNFPTKFGVKFATLFPSSQFDWQVRNEIAKFVVNFGNSENKLQNTLVKSYVKPSVNENTLSSQLSLILCSNF